jgi:hypothetical membrane protein
MRTTIGALVLLSGIVLMLVGVFAPRAHYEVPGAETTPWRVLLVLAFPASWLIAGLIWAEVF